MSQGGEALYKELAGLSTPAAGSQVWFVCAPLAVSPFLVKWLLVWFQSL